MDQVETESCKGIIILAVLVQLGFQLIVNGVEEEFLGVTDVLMIALVEVFCQVVSHGHPFLDVEQGMASHHRQDLSWFGRILNVGDGTESALDQVLDDFFWKVCKSLSLVNLASSPWTQCAKAFAWLEMDGI